MKKIFIGIVSIVACVAMMFPVFAFAATSSSSNPGHCRILSIANSETMGNESVLAGTKDAILSALNANFANRNAASVDSIGDSVQQNGIPGSNFVDENNNGICDNYENGYCPNGYCLGHNGRHTYSNDPSTQGSCAYCGNYGHRYIDSNNDGICDNYQGRGNSGNSGNGGHGHGYGYGYGYHHS